jgi:hypothetical protein
MAFASLRSLYLAISSDRAHPAAPANAAAAFIAARYKDISTPPETHG